MYFNFDDVMSLFLILILILIEEIPNNQDNIGLCGENLCSGLRMNDCHTIDVIQLPIFKLSLSCQTEPIVSD